MSRNREIVIVTPIKKYKLSELNIKGLPNISFLKELGMELKDSKFIQDQETFLSKLKSDYK